MGDHIGASRQNHLYREQSRSHKKEGKFQRLRNAGSHTCQRRGQKQTARRFFLLRFRALVHGQGRARKSEDHKDKFTREISCGIRAEMSDISGVRKLRKEDILSSLHHLSRYFHGSAHRSLPEGHIEHMMKPEGNQGSLNKAEDQGSHIPGACDKTSQRVNTILYHRPYKKHQDSHKHINNSGNNRYKPCPTEEGQGIRKLDPVKPVVESRHSQSYDNTAENTHLQRLYPAYICNRSFQNGFRDLAIIQNLSVERKHGVDRCVHNKIGNNRRKRGYFFLLFRHTDSDSHGKDQRRIVEYGAAYFVHDHQQRVKDGTLSENRRETVCLNCRGICKGTSDSQQKTCYRKNRNWEHKAPSHSLQDTENPVFHVTSLLLFP